MKTLTPSALNRLVKNLLSDTIPPLCVEGEISNFSQPSSGHLYFTLKDNTAQIRCAMFRPRSTYLRVKPKDGDRVRARGQVSLYEARGDFQLIVAQMIPAGAGDLARRFELLKQKLAAEGLFAAEKKRPLPTMPASIGIVTAAGGAALQDILSVLARRFPLVEVCVYGCLVQGEQAPASIDKALTRADSDGHDVLLLARGGGSLEDLWAFNDEALARKIAACNTPIVSAVGHDTDFTMADFAADLRAATPSVAAELVVPDSARLQAQINTGARALVQRSAGLLGALAQRLDHLENRLGVQHPGQHLEGERLQLQTQRRRMEQALRKRLAIFEQCYTSSAAGLRLRSPERLIESALAGLKFQRKAMLHASKRTVEYWREKLANTAASLDELSPLATLKRGYSVTRRADTGALISSIAALTEGEGISTRVTDGEIQACISKLCPLEPGAGT